MVTWDDLLLPVVLIIGGLSILVILIGMIAFSPQKGKRKH